MNVQKFQVGSTYEVRSNCDQGCVFAYEVVSRTAKFAKIKTVSTGEVTRVGISLSMDGKSEQMYPQGKFSMAPILRA